MHFVSKIRSIPQELIETTFDIDAISSRRGSDCLSQLLEVFSFSSTFENWWFIVLEGSLVWEISVIYLEGSLTFFWVTSIINWRKIEKVALVITSNWTFHWLAIQDK
jgi:hypothetical protein